MMTFENNMENEAFASDEQMLHFPLCFTKHLSRMGEKQIQELYLEIFISTLSKVKCIFEEKMYTAFFQKQIHTSK